MKKDLTLTLWLFALLLFGTVLVFFKQLTAAIYVNTLTITIAVLLSTEER